MQELTSTETETVQTFNYDQLDEEVQHFYDDVEQQIADINEQYRVAIGSIVQQVVDMRGMDEAKAWFLHRFEQSQTTFYKYLQLASGKDTWALEREQKQQKQLEEKAHALQNSVNDEVTSGEEPTTDTAPTVTTGHFISNTEYDELQLLRQQKAQRITHTRTGGNHKGPPTYEKDGVKRVMRNYDGNWQNEYITVPTGYACGDLKTGVRDHLTASNKLVCYFQNDTYHRTATLETYISSKATLAHRFRELADKLDKYTP
jgi:hypothetical protein